MNEKVGNFAKAEISVAGKNGINAFKRNNQDRLRESKEEKKGKVKTGRKPQKRRVK